MPQEDAPTIKKQEQKIKTQLKNNYCLEGDSLKENSLYHLGPA